MTAIQSIFTLSLFLATSAFALPFQPGEKLGYSLEWTIFTAGHMTMTIGKQVNDRQGNVVYPITAIAKSTKAVSAIYPLTETLTSSWDQRFFSRAFEQHGKEGGDTKDIVQTHDYQTHTVTLYKNKDWKENKVTRTYTFTNPIQDVLSGLYFLRMSNLPAAGQELRFPATWEGEPYEAVVKFVEADTIKFKKRKIPCNVYVFDLYKDGKVDIGGTKIWISTESDRMVMRMDAKLPVGKMHINLESVEQQP